MPFSATITMKVNTSNAPKSPLLPLPSPPPQSQSPPSPSLWRFWKWAPPLGAGRPSSASGQTDDYGQLMASFKEHLTASPTFLYAINELRLFAMLEAPSILDYVNEEGSFLEGGGNGGGGGSTGSSSSLASYSSGASSSGNHSPGHHSFSSSSSSSSTTSVRGYYIFKDGIWPLWEDEYNVAGGCWTFRHTVSRNNGSSGGQPREMWKRLILTLSDPRMAPFLEAGEICGAGLTVRETARGWTYKFSIWNNNADNTISKLMIGATLKSLVSLPNGSNGSSSRLFYYSHRTNMQHQHQHNPPLGNGALGGGAGLKRKAPRSGSFSFAGGRGGGAGAPRKKSVTFLQ